MAPTKPNARLAPGEAVNLSSEAANLAASHSSTPQTQCTELAHIELRHLLDGGPPSDRQADTFGDWRETVAILRDAHARGGAEAVRKAWNALAKADPTLHRLVSAAANRKTVWTRRELYDARFPDPEWLIDDLLPLGLACLAGRPKVGKSWLLLQIAHAVSTGGMLFGRRVKQGPVLYLALEDSERRLRARCESQGIPRDADITFALQWPTLDNGGLARLQAEADGGDYRLVIVDTFSRIAGSTDQDDVGATTVVMSSLQEVAATGNRCILLSDHHRKPSVTAADPIDDILGSTGKSAVVDTAWGLYRQRGKREVELKIVGRDVEETDLALQWDGLTLAWQCLGEAGTVRRDSFKGQVLQTIRELIATGETATVTSIARHLDAGKGNVSKATSDLIAAGIVRQGKAKGATIPLELVQL